MSRTSRLLFASMGLMVVCALAASCAAAADDPPPANQGRRGQGGRGGGGDLTSNEKVQADLKLTDDQKDSIKKILASARDNRQSLQGLSREERTTKMQEMRKDQEDKIAAVLTPEQKTRMKEIRLQARGPAALSDKETQEALKLTDDQVNKIKDLNKTMQDAVREAFQGGGGGGGPSQEARDKVTKLRTETNEKILAVLTADQKTQFEKMQGTKIEGLPTGGFGGGFGFGGGAGGGGRRNRGGNGGN